MTPRHKLIISAEPETINIVQKLTIRTEGYHFHFTPEFETFLLEEIDKEIKEIKKSTNISSQA